MSVRSNKGKSPIVAGFIQVLIIAKEAMVRCQ